MKDKLSLEITKIIPASQEEVFNAWLDVEAIKSFMIPMAGTTVSGVLIDPKIGGTFAFSLQVGETTILLSGKYKTIEPFEKLSFSWNSPHVAKDSLVTLQFRSLSQNETEITLLHQGLQSIEEQNAHTGGWEGILGQLAKAVRSLQS